MALGTALMLIICMVLSYVLGVYVGFYGCRRMYEEAISNMMLKQARTRVSDLYPEKQDE